MSRVADGIDQLLEEPLLADLVAVYFDDAGPFAGHLFDDIGDNPADAFTVSDLLAVSLLDVAFGPAAVRRLMSPDEGWPARLVAVTSTKPLWDVDPAVMSAAGELWEQLVRLPGVGPTKAGKLLARKRPALIPIYDDVVATFLAPPPGLFWVELAEALRNSDRRTALDRLVAPLDSAVTTLRSLDVAVWMRCGRSQNAVDARLQVGLPADPLQRR